MINNDFRFYGKEAYYRDVTRRIDQTKEGDSVAVATMNFEPRYEEVGVLVSTLCDAASRGVHVTLMIDAYNFLMNEHKIVGPLWFTKDVPQHIPPYYRRKLALLKRLKTCGGQYVITNVPGRPFSMPFGGRSHIKFAVINDYLYVGGCNLSSVNIDLMVGWRDAATAKWLLDFAHKVYVTKNIRAVLKDTDVIRKLDDQTHLLIDAGVPKQSVIYEKALELIDQAEKSIYITCQFFPNSITTRHLAQAHQRGVDVTIIFNHPWQHHTHYPLQRAVIWRERMRMPTVFFSNQLPRSHKYIHAKLLVTEKGAIIGSHNYVPTGVNLGTAEIALLRHDITFAQNAVAALKHELPPLTQ